MELLDNLIVPAIIAGTALLWKIGNELAKLRVVITNLEQDIREIRRDIAQIEDEIEELEDE
jgi:archaellum component FlaC